MARPRKKADTSTGKIGKEKKEARKEAEKKLKLGREQLVVPDWMQEDEIAAREFERVVIEYGKIDLLDNLDLSTLAIYCKAYSSYVDITEKIEENGYVTSTTDGGRKIDPLVTAQDRYVNQIFRCSAKLGLATTDRLKLIVSATDNAPPNKFLRFLE